MAAKRSKIHHYVPQVLQRPFLNGDGQIWYAERDEAGKFGKPERRNTKSAFKKRDYYTVIEDGKPSDRIEREFYSILDDFLGGFLEEVHEALDKGQSPLVEGDSLLSVRRVVYHLTVRTPEFAGKYDDYEIGKEFLEGVLGEAIKQGYPSDDINDIRVELANETRVTQQGRSIRVKGQALPTEKTEEALDRLDVRFARIQGKHSFILSSLAAYRIGNGGPNGLSNPNTEIWLPISPKRALVLLQDRGRRIPLVVDENRDHVRQINEFAVRNASQVASHSERLLKSLLATN